MVNLKDEIFINATMSWCPVCKKSEFTRIMARNDGVFMQRVCPEKPANPFKIAADYKWYSARMEKPQGTDFSDNTQKAVHGCPLDCGLCERHTQSIKLPVFSITNDCNLDCPICFTHNRTDAHYYKPVSDVNKILGHVFDKKQKRQIVNITGGEPTLHPEIESILKACKEKGIERITMNTNGILIAADKEFAKRLKDLGVQLVLSLDSLDPEKCKLIHGEDISKEKIKALAILEELDIPTTILSVCIKDINEKDVAEIAQTYIKKDFVKSITIQNMTYTGKNGSQFHPRKHITLDEVENLLAEKPEFSVDDFFPLASYHPLCYSVAYYIVHENKILSMSKIIDKDTLSKSTQGLYYMEPGSEMAEDFMNGITNLWSQGYDEDFLMDLKRVVKELYPDGKEISNAERKKALEKKIKSIYIHPHMDEDNFDLDRICRCGDIVPDEDGRMIPACSYNLLYRQKDSRFWID